MDPIALASATLIANWAAESFVKESAKSAWSAVQSLYNTVKSKLAGKSNSTDALDRLQAKPDSQGRAIELAEAISELIKTDPTFRSQLETEIDKINDSKELGSIVTTIRDNARVGKLTNIGVVHGDIHF